MKKFLFALLAIVVMLSPALLRADDGTLATWIPDGNPAYPFNVNGACTTFSNTDRPDCVANWGFNNNVGGALPNGEAAMYMQLESHYLPPGHDEPQFEYWWGAFNGQGNNKRVMQLDVKKDTLRSYIVWNSNMMFRNSDGRAMMLYGDGDIRVPASTSFEGTMNVRTFVDGKIVKTLNVEQGRVGFFNQRPIERPTCATIEACVRELDRMGLIDYTGE